jgi:hypothetical protein
MPTVRTISPTLSTLTDKATAQAVSESVAFVGLAVRTADARAAGKPVMLTKAEAVFLRSYVADGIDPLTALREAETMLRVYDARTLAVEVSGPRIDVPRIKSGQTGADGRTLAVVVRKDMSEGDKSRALAARKDHTEGAKALALLDTLRMVRLAWDHARAASIGFAAVNPERPVRVGKRVQAHGDALLSASPEVLATFLKSLGLDDATAGMIVAVAKAKAAAPAAPAVPALV